MVAAREEPVHSLFPYHRAFRTGGTRTMSDLSERFFVKCPYNLAQGYLSDDMKSRAATGTPVTITLRAPIGSTDLTKDEDVTVGAGVDPMHFDEPWKIHWTPKAGGPYPDFDGELTVRADETYSAAILELRGTYCVRPAHCCPYKLRVSRSCSVPAPSRFHPTIRRLPEAFVRDYSVLRSISSRSHTQSANDGAP